MELLALTRASTLGPIVDHVRRGGGSIARVFKIADIPLELVDRPTALLPLRDHFKIVEAAARELDDPALPARLAVAAGVSGLGTFSARFMAAPDLGSAIVLGNQLCTSILQSGTRLGLAVTGRCVKWSYEVLESERAGRQKNEVLALGYMLNLLRAYAGPAWTSGRVAIPGGNLTSRAHIETLFECEISTGDVMSVSFPSYWLETGCARSACARAPEGDAELPEWSDLPASLRELIRLGLLGGRPDRGWVAARLGTSVRTMQRRLRQHDVSFAHVVRETILGEAIEMLRKSLSITEVAMQLGYSDPAHFTRAFRRQFGMTPGEWRRANAGTLTRHRKYWK
jgi:AraC-like DNA-binding protein